MTLENYSRRDRMWFHPTIRLRRDTTPEQIREMMDALTKILEEHPKVDAGGLPLRFAKIGDQAFDLEIFAYVNTADGNEFLKVQNELLLQFLRAGIDRGVGFAVPMTETLNITPPANQQGVWNFHPTAALPEEHQPRG
jgi:MscS family membrane protein